MRQRVDRVIVCACFAGQSIERSRHSGPAADMESCNTSQPSSTRQRQSPMDSVCPDLAARIIEEALSPTPLQNVDLASRYCDIQSVTPSVNKPRTKMPKWPVAYPS